METEVAFRIDQAAVVRCGDGEDRWTQGGGDAEVGQVGILAPPAADGCKSQSAKGRLRSETVPPAQAFPHQLPVDLQVEDVRG